MLNVIHSRNICCDSLQYSEYIVKDQESCFSDTIISNMNKTEYESYAHTHTHIHTQFTLNTENTAVKLFLIYMLT